MRVYIRPGFGNNSVSDYLWLTQATAWVFFLYLHPIQRYDRAENSGPNTA